MTVFINQDTSKITVDQGTDNVRVVVPGVKGEGVPAGGTTGQVLAKVDNTDYNTEWVDGGSGQGDFLTPQEVLAGSNVTVDTTTTPGSVIVSASDPGATEHALLLNRDAADSHPISAVTGLVDALAGKLSPSQVEAGTNITVDTVSSPGNVIINATTSGGTAPTVENIPAGSTLTVFESGGAYPARPTARTDVVVVWVGSTDPVAVALDGVDAWDQI